MWSSSPKPLVRLAVPVGLWGLWACRDGCWWAAGLCWSLGVTVGLCSAGPCHFYQTPFFLVSFQEVLLCYTSNTRIWLVRMDMEFLFSNRTISICELVPCQNTANAKSSKMTTVWLFADTATLLTTLVIGLWQTLRSFVYHVLGNTWLWVKICAP